MQVNEDFLQTIFIWLPMPNIHALGMPQGNRTFKFVFSSGKYMSWTLEQKMPLMKPFFLCSQSCFVCHLSNIPTIDQILTKTNKTFLVHYITDINDVYSGDRYSGNDRYSGLINPDDAILFNVSRITAIADKIFEILMQICHF